MVDALTLKSDEGRSVAAISFGEVPSNLRSGDLRMGKPIPPLAGYLASAGSAPREVKHSSTWRNRKQSRLWRDHSLSSGERNGRSPNLSTRYCVSRLWRFQLL
jgi:hypothetical protein